MLGEILAIIAVAGSLLFFLWCRDRYKRATSALVESKEKYDVLFHGSQDAIFIHDLEGVIIDVNQSLLDLFGYTNEEMLAFRILDLHPPEALETGKRAFEEIMEKGEVQFEISFARKNGETFPAEVSSKIFELGGKTVVQGIARDITFRKRAEEKLRTSENRYRNLFKNSCSMMLVIDPENGSIVDANPAACSFYGFNHEELTAKMISDINQLTQEEVFDEMACAEKEERNHFLFRHELKSGEVRDVEVFSGPIELHGRNLLYSIIHDVTDRRIAESERESLIIELQEAISEIKTLRGIIPLCSFCKKIRDDRGFWERVDVYLQKYSQADVSHGICPECAKKHYPELLNENLET